MNDKGKLPLGDNLSGAAKEFYDSNSPEEACIWLSEFIGYCEACSDCLFRCIERYGNRAEDIDATVIGAVAKIIDSFSGRHSA